ncbi:MAG: MAPEG family protein [Pseudomonadota bacterium]
MQTLPITLISASILGLMFVWLSARVIALRVSNQVGIGDEGHNDLLYRIRTHANFTEYVPIFLILLALLEFMGGAQTILGILAAVFIGARLLHVPGMGENANIMFRQAGIIGSFTCIVGASLYGLYIALM